MVDAAHSVNSPLDGQPVQIRVGMHSGPVMAGVGTSTTEKQREEANDHTTRYHKERKKAPHVITKKEKKLHKLSQEKQTERYLHTEIHTERQKHIFTERQKCRSIDRQRG